MANACPPVQCRRHHRYSRGDRPDAGTSRHPIGDVTWIRRERSSSRPGRALRSLGVEGYEEILRGLVASDVPSVAREAASALLLTGSRAVDDVWTAAEESPHRIVRSGVLRLIRTAGKWHQLKLYLQAAGLGDPELTNCTIELIAQWVERFNRSYAQPSAVDTADLLERTDSLRPLLPRSLIRELEFILRTPVK